MRREFRKNQLVICTNPGNYPQLEKGEYYSIACLGNEDEEFRHEVLCLKIDGKISRTFAHSRFRAATGKLGE